MPTISIRTLSGQSVTLGVSDGRFTAPDGDAPLDLTGLHAVRGLVDAHAHLANESIHDVADLTATPPGSPKTRAWTHLESGVFLLFDKGGRDRSHLRILSEPPSRRPDLEMAGTILYPPGGYYAGFADLEVDLADLTSIIGEQASGDASWVKLVGDWPKPGQGPTPNYTEEQLAEVVSVAHGAGRRVAIHAAAPRTSSMAVAAGVDSIEHGLFLTPDDVAALGARGGAWVPTISAMTMVRDSLRPGGSGWNLFDEGIANARSLLVDAVDAGVTVLCGTDLGLAHGQVAHEAVELARSGLSPEQTVTAVTTAGYDYAGLGSSFAPGEPADVVAFAANPLEDITTLTSPVVVIRRGSVLVDRR